MLRTRLRARALQGGLTLTATGGGFEKFCAGSIDVADASRPTSEAKVDSLAGTPS